MTTYKTCAVPLCKSTSIKCPQKLFIHVPKYPKRRKRWLQLARRNPEVTSDRSTIFFCEDHFNLPNDMENYMQYSIMGSVGKIIMKPDCLPTRFECQPDRRKRTRPLQPRSAVNKRRRMDLIQELVSKETKMPATLSNYDETAEEIKEELNEELKWEPHIEESETSEQEYMGVTLNEDMSDSAEQAGAFGLSEEQIKDELKIELKREPHMEELETSEQEYMGVIFNEDKSDSEEHYAEEIKVEVKEELKWEPHTEELETSEQEYMNEEMSDSAEQAGAYGMSEEQIKLKIEWEWEPHMDELETSEQEWMGVTLNEDMSGSEEEAEPRELVLGPVRIQLCNGTLSLRVNEELNEGVNECMGVEEREEGSEEDEVAEVVGLEWTDTGVKELKVGSEGEKNSSSCGVSEVAADGLYPVIGPEGIQPRAVTLPVQVNEELKEGVNEEYAGVEELKEGSEGEDISGSCGVSEEAAKAGLYSGHKVEDDLVIGPEGIHSCDVTSPVRVKEELKEGSNEEYAGVENLREPWPEEEDISGSCGVSEVAAESGLYTGHKVEDDLVIGPEGIQSCDVTPAVRVEEELKEGVNEEYAGVEELKEVGSEGEESSGSCRVSKVAADAGLYLVIGPEGIQPRAVTLPVRVNEELKEGVNEEYTGVEELKEGSEGEENMGSCGVRPAGLYAGHKVEDDLVLGPEDIKSCDVTPPVRVKEKFKEGVNEEYVEVEDLREPWLEAEDISGYCGVSEVAAESGLYAGHKVEDDLVIGPEGIQSCDVTPPVLIEEELKKVGSEGEESSGSCRVSELAADGLYLVIGPEGIQPRAVSLPAVRVNEELKEGVNEEYAGVEELKEGSEGEGNSGFCGVSEVAREAGLYAGHKVEDDLVLGPEGIQSCDVTPPVRVEEELKEGVNEEYAGVEELKEVGSEGEESSSSSGVSKVAAEAGLYLVIGPEGIQPRAVTLPVRVEEELKEGVNEEYAGVEELKEVGSEGEESSGSCRVSKVAAEAGLYLVIGPEGIQPRAVTLPVQVNEELKEGMNEEYAVVEELKEGSEGEDISGSCGVSEVAAKAGLYAGHKVEDDLVLGPEGIQSCDVTPPVRVKEELKEGVNEEYAGVEELKEVGSEGEESSGSCRVSEVAAKAGLYLVIGPEGIQPRAVTLPVRVNEELKEGVNEEYAGVEEWKEPCSEGEENTGSCGVSDVAAEAGLYTGHKIEDDLVLGPEVIQSRDVTSTVQVKDELIKESEWDEHAEELNRGDESDGDENAGFEGLKFGGDENAEIIELEEDGSELEFKGTSGVGKVEVFLGDLGLNNEEYEEQSAVNEPVKDALQADVKFEIVLGPDGIKLRDLTVPVSSKPKVKETKKLTRQYDTPESFPCDLCEREFTDNQNLIRHKRIHTGERPYACDMCEQKFTRSCSLRMHKLIHTGHKRYACKYCDRRFTQLGHVQRHELTHIGEKRFPCGICDKMFIAASCARKHEKIHKNPFACSMCDRSFTEADKLKKHEDSHKEPRPYRCNKCDKAFTHVAYLRSHERTHSDYMPYCCKLCPKKFKYGCSLTAHERAHTGERPYACSVCGKRLTTAWILKKHHRLMHSKK